MSRVADEVTRTRSARSDATRGRVLAVLAVIASGAAALGACVVPPKSPAGAPGATPGGGSGGSVPAPAPAAGPAIGGCPVFPAGNAWNTKVDALAVRPDSSAFVASISSGGQTKLHPDFGGNGAYGIPFVVVPSTQPKVAINYTAYGDESDPGPFPIPATAPVEGGSASTGDRHVLVLQKGTCHLYELGRAFWRGDHWDADVGVNWDLRSNKLRPLGWTSADAAGLAILPGLVRYDEVAAGHVDHALRFTVSSTQKGYVFPATHYASSSTNAALPPMGLRLRLKATFSLAPYHGEALVILKALKAYGMIVADNGSSWYVTGAADARWNDDDLDQLKSVPGSALEAVDTGPIHH
jgi:hypothetical protein